MAVRGVNISGLQNSLAQLGQANAALAARREQKRRQRGAQLQTIGSIGGAILGGSLGGPGGAAIGGAIGGAAGKTLGGGEISSAEAAQFGFQAFQGVQRQNVDAQNEKIRTAQTKRQNVIDTENSQIRALQIEKGQFNQQQNEIKIIQNSAGAQARMQPRQELISKWVGEQQTLVNQNQDLQTEAEGLQTEFDAIEPSIPDQTFELHDVSDPLTPGFSFTPEAIERLNEIDTKLSFLAGTGKNIEITNLEQERDAIEHTSRVTTPDDFIRLSKQFPLPDQPVFNEEQQQDRDRLQQEITTLKDTQKKVQGQIATEAPQNILNARQDLQILQGILGSADTAGTNKIFDKMDEKTEDEEKPDTLEFFNSKTGKPWVEGDDPLTKSLVKITADGKIEEAPKALTAKEMNKNKGDGTLHEIFDLGGNRVASGVRKSEFAKLGLQTIGSGPNVRLDPTKYSVHPISARPKPSGKVNLSPDEKTTIINEGFNSVFTNRNLGQVGEQGVQGISKESDLNKRGERIGKTRLSTQLKEDLQTALTDEESTDVMKLTAVQSLLGEAQLAEVPDQVYLSEEKRLIKRIKAKGGGTANPLGDSFKANEFGFINEMHKKARNGEPITDSQKDMYNLIKSDLDRDVITTDPQGNKFIRKAMNLPPAPASLLQSTQRPDPIKIGDATDKFIGNDFAMEHGLPPNTTIAEAAEMNLRRKLTATEKTRLQDSATATDTAQALLSSYDRGFVGPIAGPVYTQFLGGKLGLGLTPKKGKFLTNSRGLLNATVKAITGAQMSNPESVRIQGQVPHPSDPPLLWEAKMRFTKRNLQSIRDRILLDPSAPVSLNIPEGFTIEWPAFPNDKAAFDQLPSGSYYFHPETGLQGIKD